MRFINSIIIMIHSLKSRISALLILGVVLTSISLLPSTCGTAGAKINSDLKKKIGSDSGSTWTWDVMIVFKQDEIKFNSILAYVSNLTVPEGQEYLKSYESRILLERYAEETQGKVIEGINEFKKSYRGDIRHDMFWMTNELGLYNAPKELLDLLGDDGKSEFANITNITTIGKIYVPERDRSTDDDGGSAEESQKKHKHKPMKEAWGLDYINAPTWWDAGFNGAGVIVGHIDTGADCRHPSLKWNWMGKAGDGWHDPGNATVNTFPFEQDRVHSSGTHLLGIMIGRGRGSSDKKESDVEVYGVGVAPGARWTSCVACNRLACAFDVLYNCSKFMHCPNMRNKCKYRPDIVLVSVGIWQTSRIAPKNKTYPYQSMIELFVKVGIIPVWPAGDNGEQGCETVMEPENVEIFNVGNIDKQGRLARNSSLGPPANRYSYEDIGKRNIIKPDLVAPGSKIYSTIYTGKSAAFDFDYSSGTPEAAAHLTGAIALILSRTRGLGVPKLKEILFNHTVKTGLIVRNLGPPYPCLKIKDEVIPNHKLGYGRLWLPEPEDLNLMNVTPLPPIREMPPPPDYSDLSPDSTPPSVRPGMVGVIIMASGAFLMHAVQRLN